MTLRVTPVTLHWFCLCTKPEKKKKKKTTQQSVLRQPRVQYSVISNQEYNEMKGKKKRKLNNRFELLYSVSTEMWNPKSELTY